MGDDPYAIEVFQIWGFLPYTIKRCSKHGRWSSACDDDVVSLVLHDVLQHGGSMTEVCCGHLYVPAC